MPLAVIVSPSLLPGGNRVTALRWAKRLRELAWDVKVDEAWDGRPADILIALHARKSRDSIERWSSGEKTRPLVVAATGTDVYVDLQGDSPEARSALEGLERADRIVVLQKHGLQDLPAHLHERARVVHQSLHAGGVRPDADPEKFEVVVLGNLRAVKDPLLTARAVRRLPEQSRIRVRHLGRGLEPELAEQARRLRGPRWSWEGVVSRRDALCALAGSRLTIMPSRVEGGANVASEALALGVPILATRIPGTTGLLGEDHPGLFEVGDDEGLARLLLRAEQDPRFLADLHAAGTRLAHLADPETERETWRGLLAELMPGAADPS